MAPENPELTAGWRRRVPTVWHSRETVKFAEHRPAPMRIPRIPWVFAPADSPGFLLHHVALTADHIAHEVQDVVVRRA
jgi:hypothetical protein